MTETNLENRVRQKEDLDESKKKLKVNTPLLSRKLESTTNTSLSRLFTNS